jgi:hypothetical protein
MFKNKIMIHHFKTKYFVFYNLSPYTVTYYIKKRKKLIELIVGFSKLNAKNWGNECVCVRERERERERDTKKQRDRERKT